MKPSEQLNKIAEELEEKKMKIEIIISKEDAEHLRSPHTFYDECEIACVQLRKLQKEIDKKLETPLDKWKNKKISKPKIVKFVNKKGNWK